MTGQEFEQAMINLGHTQEELAQHWGCCRQTVAKQCQAKRVKPVYADAIEFSRSSLSKNTLKAYTASLRIFNAWCTVHGYDPLQCTPNHIANFVANQAAGTLSRWVPYNRRKSADGGYLTDGDPVKPATINTRLSAIRWLYQRQGDISPTDSPIVTDAFAGIRNKLGVRPNKKQPVTNEMIMDMIEATPRGGLVGYRDRALLLLGFSGAFRRSELVALQRADITIHPQGADILIQRSKGDQAGEGETKPVLRVEGDYCPVSAVELWLTAADIRSGPVFRRLWRGGKLADKALTGQSVADLVKKYAAKVGLDDLVFPDTACVGALIPMQLILGPVSQRSRVCPCRRM